MRKIIDIEELKRIQLDILLKVHSFCEDKGIRYSLDSGTLLGAVRHKGYIPWDDDIDIIMPRPDYDSFLHLFNGSVSDLRVYAPELDWNFYAPYANVCDMRTLLLEGANSHREIEMGIKIDVFPVDGAPSDDQEYYQVLDRIAKLNNRLFAKRYKVSKMPLKSYKSILMIALYKVIFCCQSYASIQKKISLLSTKYNFEDSEMAAKLSYTWTKNRSQRKMFEDYMYCEFEGNQFKILKNYDDYLKKLYGNYMELPPLRDRITHHNFCAFWR